MVEEARTLSSPGALDQAARAKEVEEATERPGAGARFHRYQVLRPLAQGGMGIVYAGRLEGSHGLSRLVAIKTLRPISSANARSALLGEARVTARLHHRNVVATLDLGEVDDVPYVVMELIDGVSLARLLQAVGNGTPLQPNLAAWIVMQAALGLHAAHELTDVEGKPLGLIHRDVSPQNILLSLQGEVKIADFGVAKFAGREESTAAGMIKGKFAYMSPEQAGDHELDRRSDIFALGVVLWEALTGARLFAADTPARTIMRVLELEPKPPSALVPGVSEALSTITLRCLAKDPAGRFASAADLADAIRSALRSDPTAAPVDEADLSLVVRKLFAAPCAELMQELREATLGGTTRTFPTSMGPGASNSPLMGLGAPSPPDEVAARAPAPLTGANASEKPAARRGRLVPVIALLTLLAVGGGAGLVWRARALRHIPDPPIAGPVATAEPSGITSQASPPPPPAAIPSADPPAAAPTASHAPTPPPPKPRRAGGRAVATPAVSVSAGRPPASPAASGLPFPTL